MNVHRTAMIFWGTAAALILGGCATTSPGDGMGAGAAPSAISAPSDPYQACLARIPKDATPGQRDLATRSCARDEEERKAALGVGSRSASGHAGDSLQACLARIPKDASSGQRMIAERTCERDEAERR